MGYLGVHNELLEARSGLRCDVVPACECSTGCGGGVGGDIPQVVARVLYRGAGDNLLRDATDGLNFPTEIMQALPGASLSLAKWLHLGMSDGRTCYFAGGTYRVGSTTGVPNTFTTTVDAIDLSTDTSAAAGNLNGNRAAGMGIGNQDVGYALGGFDSSLLSLYAESFSYATATFTLLGTTLQTLGVYSTEQFVYEGGETSSLTHGYVLGGLYWDTPIRITSIDVVDLSTATASLMGSVSSEARSDIAAAGNADVGYFMGGDKSVYPSSELAVTSLVEALTYATDSLAITSSLSFNVMNASGTGTDTYGYMCGGYLGDVSATWLSSCSRVEYTTGTVSSVASASLRSGARSSMEAAGPSFY